MAGAGRYSADLISCLSFALDREQLFHISLDGGHPCNKSLGGQRASSRVAPGATGGSSATARPGDENADPFITDGRGISRLPSRGVSFPVGRDQVHGGGAIMQQSSSRVLVTRKEE